MSLHRSGLLFQIVVLSAVFILGGAAGCGGGSPVSPSTPSPAPGTAAPPPAPSPAPSPGPAVAYTNDIRPIFEMDCLFCHSAQARTAGVDLSSYRGAMDAAQGGADSRLVRVTRQGGIMYVNLTGNQAAKSELIRAWVVDNNLRETR